MITGYLCLHNKKKVRANFQMLTCWLATITELQLVLQLMFNYYALALISGPCICIGGYDWGGHNGWGTGPLQ